MEQTDERRMTERADGRIAPSAFPARRVYAWMAALVAAFAIYASLLPFEFQSMPFDRALARFVRIMLGFRYETTSRSNYLANALLFVPIGFGLAAVALLDRRRGSRMLLALPAILTVSVAVSLTAEFLQMFVPGRVVSFADVTAQTLGCIVGFAAWLIAGDWLTSWLRTASDRQRGDRVARALSAYAVVWSFVNLAPFDVTVDLGTIASRYRRGLIALVPFGEREMHPLQLAWDGLAAMLSAAPLGVLGLVGWTGLGARRHARAAFAFGAAFVVLMEVAQIFIRSHASDANDVLFGLLGVAAGVWLGRRALLHRRPVDAVPPSAVSRPALVVLVLWCGVLCAYHWLPYDFTFDAQEIRNKLGRMSLVPFAGYWSGSYLNTLNNVLAKLALSVPFGIIASFVVSPRAVSPTVVTAGSILAAAAVFAGIEAGQLLLPSRTPDPSDVLMSVLGSAAGLCVGRWLRP